jgi:hypothetical protein
MIMLLYLLDKKLGGLPWREWSLPFLGLASGEYSRRAVAGAAQPACVQASASWSFLGVGVNFINIARF